MEPRGPSSSDPDGWQLAAIEKLMNAVLNAVVCFEDPACGAESEEFAVAMGPILEWCKFYGYPDFVDQIPARPAEVTTP